MIRQVCGLSTLYCCFTADGEAVNTHIPAQWPPDAEPIPDALRSANLSCAARNCTQQGLSALAGPLRAFRLVLLSDCRLFLQEVQVADQWPEAQSKSVCHAQACGGKVD